MKTPRSLCWFALTIIMSQQTLPTLARAQPTEARSGDDSVMLSQEWGGVSIDKFPAVANLEPQNYSVTRHLINEQVRVITVNPRGARKWQPRELPAFAFDFSPKEGLREISGFINGSPHDVLRRLRARYGKPVQGVRSLGIAAFNWEIGTTSLEVRGNIFRLRPLGKTDGN